MTENYKFIRNIGYLGLIPFVSGAILSTGLIPSNTDLQKWIVLFSIHYAAIILSFMSGVLWGFELLTEHKKSKHAIIIALIPPLWASFSYFLPLRCFLFAIGFLGLYWLDIFMARKKATPEWWLKLRAPLTTLVVASLVVMGFND